MKRYQKLFKEKTELEDLRFNIKYSQEELDYLRVQLEKTQNDYFDAAVEDRPDLKQKVNDLQDKIKAKSESLQTLKDQLKKLTGEQQ